MSIAGKTSHDLTDVTVTTPDGTEARLKGVRLSAEEAALLGEYASWVSRERLMPKLFCRQCGPECEVEVNIDPTVIGIICGHQILFYEGHVPVVETHHRDQGETLIALQRVVIPDVPLSAADALMIRRYDKFCRLYGFREAMWCGVCEDEGNHPGIRSEVTPLLVSHLCRHAHRVYTGVTV